MARQLIKLVTRYNYEPRIISRKLLMIKPARFSLNSETAKNNVYQTSLYGVTNQEAEGKARVEFDALVTKLRQHKIETSIFEDTEHPRKPDAVFPNNWISFHEDGRIGLFPMYAKIRRVERRKDIIQGLVNEYGYKVVDYTNYENESKFLEGTGSMVLDRDNRIAYACKSARTHPDVLNAFCKEFDYRPVLFEAEYCGVPIYHTNVMMSITREFAMICVDSITENKKEVLDTLNETGKQILHLSEHQTANFCGNCLAVSNIEGDLHMCMSSTAFNALTDRQKEFIEHYYKIVHSPIPTIETLGGGSVRCMLAEVYS
ncbi:uncharacterized protein [Dysidea avara]|uniref:uncharacterized protein n=1 Tax=Dysidea avara TaxID=196820 RepID=UPI0033303123